MNERPVSPEAASERVLQIVGYKNSGKTTLLCRMTEHLTSLGYRVGTIKHDAHEFEMDRAGTDTWKHRTSGAARTAITSPGMTAWVEPSASTLERLVESMADMDYILVEGFKEASYRKFVLIRGTGDLPLLESTTRVAAVISRIPIAFDRAPVLCWDESGNILAQMCECLGIARGEKDSAERAVFRRGEEKRG